MSATLTQISYMALRDIGCLRPGQTTSTDVIADILESANQMIDSWTIDELMAYASPAQIFTLTASREQYQIGTGQASPNFNAMRPTGIVDANIILNTVDPVVRTPLNLITVDEWARIAVRAATPGATAPVPAIPTMLYYDGDYNATSGYATINLWPAPLETYQLEIFGPQTLPFTAFANSSTAYNFPPAYLKLLRKCLAVEIAPMMQIYNKLARIPNAPQLAMLNLVIEEARKIKELVQSYNAPDSLRVCDRSFLGSGKRGGWNYALGTYGGG